MDYDCVRLGHHEGAMRSMNTFRKRSPLTLVHTLAFGVVDTCIDVQNDLLRHPLRHSL